MMVLIIIVFAGVAYYYWHGGDTSGRTVTGIVMDKFERAAGTEAGDKPLAQGLRVLTGQSSRHESFYFIRVRTNQGGEVVMEVTKSFYDRVQVGDNVRKTGSDTTPTIIK
jgi:hypothetical protein